MNDQVAQRLRLHFSRGDEVKFLSHLDLVRFWERALRRAEVSLAYTQGFNPHPRLTLAAPLAVGCTGVAELMDIVVDNPVSEEDLARRLRDQLPAGIQLEGVSQVEVALPSLPSQVRAAEYVVTVKKGSDGLSVRERVEALLSAETLPRQRVRDNRALHYDLRPLVEELQVLTEDEEVVQLQMRLRSDSSGTGRPDEVLRQLGLPAPISICRTRLILQD